ncbi:MAG TPA: RNB domain-containing ribonuclease [Thauera aminoaromatica]|uniref:Ribonuclease II n=1 Tax=Thauera aminoaromatica TaxID=164330 RepID=C4KC80_THASP|nr:MULTISPECIES: RNB domain-containing ribonuclease [Thauera]ACR02271.1 ribonuclease II [Thauera aminoaromatica]KIN89213.1 RNB domain protein [Thauera sp. SWB20]MBL8461456.1 RNB domain-containing ribonuclease [Thauera sp.]MBP6131979.1 RNB domain-containing ribonuclease [Thauera sp.]MBP7047773.1 RNB domain-containing ribonuclease [Thauera sp.]
MFVLYEEDGAFKAGTILADNDATLQVENTHGKRVKLKRAHVLMEFREPGPSDLLARAEAEAEGLDVEFLWEVCGDDEFAFADFAAEYHGHVPNAVESAALLLRLHSAPIWFHRKGRGRFRKAPADILQAALAGLEKKRQQAAAIEHMRAELVAGRLPPELAALLPQALYRPDRNRPEIKALEAACVDSGLSAARLLLACGALASSYDFHYNRFLFEHFPEGTAFPAIEPPVLPTALPRAEVAAFSIDDASTTEIDDAFSVTPRAEGGWRIGIHIAAPALGFARGSTLDAVARRRLSTVYMPGNKITMLPDEIVQTFTLGEGRDCPAVSLYLDITPGLAIVHQESRVELVPIVANLRHHDIEPVFNDDTVHNGGPDFQWKRELTLLWDLATVLEAGRGKAAGNEDRIDFGFSVDWTEETADGPGRVSIGRRLRGSPMDKLVAELMIHANMTWGKLLDTSGIPGLYRAQGGGKVRMTTVAAPHEGLGVDCYAWSSSPLRRYVDLVNQWQIISVLQGTPPAFAPKSAELMAAMRDFELTYAEYAEFQRGMERYWCLRWLRQHGRGEVEATVLRENVVRLAEIPLVIRVPSMPLQMPGSRVKLVVERTDLLDVEVEARFVQTLAEPDPETVDEAGFGFA